MIAEDDRRKLNRPPVPPPALSDEDVAALDHLVHELGARQWKVAIKLGVSPVTVANALKRRGAYSHIPPFCRKPAAMTTPDKKSLNAWTREELLALPVRAYDLCNAAIQSYFDQQAKDLPVLPEPNVPEGDWFERDCYIKSYAQAYGQQCAAHAREKALEEVSDAINDLSYDASRLDCRIAIEALKKAR